MLAWELVVEAQALRSQGWTISAIARHLGVTRLTVRRYLSGEQTPGVRARSAPDPFAEYVEYCRLRLAADPHLWATTLFDEVTALGYGGSYPSFTRAIRERALRPVCAACKQNPRPIERRSSTRRVLKPNGTGWNCPIHRPGGAGMQRPMC